MSSSRSYSSIISPSRSSTSLTKSLILF